MQNTIRAYVLSVDLLSTLTDLDYEDNHPLVEELEKFTDKIYSELEKSPEGRKVATRLCRNFSQTVDKIDTLKVLMEYEQQTNKSSGK